MPVETTYSALREKLASYLDQVTDDREVVIVRRRGARDVALIPAEELAGRWRRRIYFVHPRTRSGCFGRCTGLRAGEGKAETVERFAAVPWGRIHWLMSSHDQAH